MKRRPASARAEILEPRALFTISFTEPATYPIAGDALTQPALADFNGDGFLDAATCHTQEGENSVSVLLNKGDGTFNAQTTLAVGARPYQVIASDFNNDTKQDLACTNVVDGTISVLLGNGDGTFQAKIDTQLGAVAPVGSGAVEYLAAGDLNKDGKLDLVVNNNSEQQLVTMLGNGDGTFTRQNDVTFSGTSAGTIALGDFSGDGFLDVATNLGNDQALTVYFIDATGNFDAGHTFPVTNLPEASTAEGVAAGDFNGDSKTDVAMLNSPFNFTSNGTLSVFLGNGDGTFQPNVNTQLSITAIDLAAADLDGDGKLDAVASQVLTGFQALRGNGDGTFATPVDVNNTTFAVSGSAAIGDLDKDNKPDLAFPHFTSSTDTLGVFLTGTPGGGGGGGGGGGEQNATATPTILATLPAAVVGGSKVKGAKLAVTVTNSGTSDLTAPVTVSLFASNDTTVDAGDTAVGTPVTKVLKLKPGATKPVKLKLTAVPSVPDGDYFLLAQTTATGATGGTAATGTTVNIAAPFVDLTGTFGAPLPPTLTAGKKGSVPLTITNAGNVNATGTVTVGLAARPSGVLDASADVAIPTVPVKLNLKPGASKTLKLKIATPAGLQSGAVFNYFGTIDSTNAITEKDETNNDLLSATTFTAG